MAEEDVVVKFGADFDAARKENEKYLKELAQNSETIKQMGIAAFAVWSFNVVGDVLGGAASAIHDFIAAAAHGEKVDKQLELAVQAC